MKAILIDDEKPALLHLERLLQADGRIEVVGKYTSARAGLEHLSQMKIDVVFLDIGMPGINGLKAAEYIREIDSHIHIVYITAYSEFALEAFEIQALDYLLKPVMADRLNKTISRMSTVVGSKSLAMMENTKEEPMVLCFKRLDSTHTAKKLHFRTLKAQELFAYLLHKNEQWVTKDSLLGTIWPEYTEDKALTHLHTSVYQIRKQLKQWGGDATVKYAHDSYRLEQKGFKVDVDLFEQELMGKPGGLQDSVERWERIEKLYRGEYLEDHDYSWAKPRRRELHQNYIRYVLLLAKQEMNACHELQAIERLRHAQEKEPYSEEICELILTAYAKLQDYESLQQYYDTFTELVRSELETEPDRKITLKYAELLQDRQ
ncbi:Transcriptional regulatory protein YehT [compost metagenome]